MNLENKTAPQLIWEEIYKEVKVLRPEFPYQNGINPSEDIIKNYFGEIQEAKENFRCSGKKTGLYRGKFHREYDSDEVAIILDNGAAIGWTYWHGGGKHGYPEGMAWIDDAYFLDVKQEVKVVNVFSFKENDDDFS